jgi:hypothetical protein
MVLYGNLKFFSIVISLASGVFAAMQGNKVTEDREFPVSPDEEEL